MSCKAQAMIDELVAACIEFGRQADPDRLTRLKKARQELHEYIAELEGFIDRLIEVGDWLNAMHEDGVFVDELNAARTSWKLAVSDWQAMPSHVTNPLDSQGIVTRNGGEG